MTFEALLSEDDVQNELGSIITSSLQDAFLAARSDTSSPDTTKSRLTLDMMSVIAFASFDKRMPPEHQLLAERGQSNLPSSVIVEEWTRYAVATCFMLLRFGVRLNMQGWRNMDWTDFWCAATHVCIPLLWRFLLLTILRTDKLHNFYDASLPVDLAYEDHILF